MVKVSGRKFIPAQGSSAEVTRGLSIGTSTNTDLRSVLPTGNHRTHNITAVVSLRDSIGVAHGADTKPPLVARLGRDPPSRGGSGRGAEGCSVPRPALGCCYHCGSCRITHAAHPARPNAWHEIRSCSRFPHFAFASASGRGSHSSPSDAAS